MDTAERAEDARYDVRHYLALRAVNAIDAATIRRHVNRQEGRDYTDDEIASALQFLTDLGQVRVTIATLGSRRYYQITAVGKLAEERGE